MYEKNRYILNNKLVIFIIHWLVITCIVFNICLADSYINNINVILKLL